MANPRILPPGLLPFAPPVFSKGRVVLAYYNRDGQEIACSMPSTPSDDGIMSFATEVIEGAWRAAIRYEVVASYT